MEKGKKYKVISIVTGLIAGLINGLFGGGGGMIVVPMLTSLLKYENKKAHATAIFIILPLSIVSGIIYAVFGNLEISIFIPTGIGVLIGGVIGAVLLKKLSAKVIVYIFSIAMIIAGVRMII